MLLMNTSNAKKKEERRTTYNYYRMNLPKFKRVVGWKKGMKIIYASKTYKNFNLFYKNSDSLILS